MHALYRSTLLFPGEEILPSDLTRMDIACWNSTQITQDEATAHLRSIAPPDCACRITLHENTGFVSRVKNNTFTIVFCGPDGRLFKHQAKPEGFKE